MPIVVGIVPQVKVGLDSPREKTSRENLAPMEIRRATDDDFAAMWPIFAEVAAAGDSYPHSMDVSYDEAFRYWLRPPRISYVAIDDRANLVGMYYLRPNQETLGAHVANAGYCVAAPRRGEGIGKAICHHSIAESRRLGYLAMQFNLVVSTNDRAIAVWKKCGFEIVGTLPKAFRHKEQGLVDAYVMYRWIGD